MVDSKSNTSKNSQKQQIGGADWDEVMLAMDVVDTLRHRKFALDEILAKDDNTLIHKIRHIYQDQGIDVADDTIREAVKALSEERFSYKPPTKGWRLQLAHAYIDRTKWVKRVAIVTVICALMCALYYIRESYKERKIQAHIESQKADEREFAQLIAESRKMIQQAQNLAKTPDAARAVDSASHALRLAIDQGNGEAAKEAANDLRSLINQIAIMYNVKIVSRPGKKSGVFRIPKDNPRGRNYYVIVEALDHNGRPVDVFVTSEEDGRTQSVNTWGLRVASSVFEKVKQDKLDDGIIQNSRVGSKHPGALQPNYDFPVEGGAITEW